MLTKRSGLLLAVVCGLMTACSGGDDDGGGETGIPEVTLGAGSYNRAVTVDGVESNYRLYVPAGVEPGDEEALPLVISLHGGGSDPVEHDLFTGFRRLADDETFVLVTPAGFATTWNAGSCCGPAETQQVDHVAVIGGLLDDVEQLVALDTTRVYVTGHSNGGMMAYRLACELSDRIAAIAPNAATMMDRDLDADPVETVYSCQPTRPVPVFHVHGLADTCVPFEGGESTGPEGGTRPPVSDSIDFWVSNNRCLIPPLLSSYNNGDARCETYTGCQDTATVTLCTIENGGHTWPGSGINPSADTCGGDAADDLEATQQIWDFFSGQSL